MWVLTENGQLINLDRFYTVDVEPYEATHLVVAHGDADIQGYIYWVVLCSCDNEEHGKEIVRHIADALEHGVKLYNIRNAKVEAGGAAQ